MTQLTARPSFLSNIMIAGTTSILVKTLVAPVDKVIMRLVNMQHLLKAGRIELPYKNPIDCLRVTVKQHGTKYLWAGNIRSVISYMPNQVLNFAIKDYLKRFNSQTFISYPFIDNFANGGMAGVLTLLITYPMGVWQYAFTQNQFNPKILFKGFQMSCLGVLMFRSTYFGLFDSLNPILPNKNNFLINFTLGYVVSVNSSLVAYPIDQLRRAMMQVNGTPEQFKNIYHCITHLRKTQTPKSINKLLFQGSFSTVNLLRSISLGLMLAFYHQFQGLYTNHYLQKSE